MKTQEELNQIQQEFETMNKKLLELDEDELDQITGGKGKRFGATPSALSLILMMLINPILLRTKTISEQDRERFIKLLKQNKIDEACKFVLGLKMADRDKQSIIKIINTYVGNI